MAHVICQPCIGEKNASCVNVCPTDAIHPTPSEPNFHSTDQLFIDPNNCIDCGLCVSACPVSAIYADYAVPSQWQSYIQKNANYYD